MIIIIDSREQKPLSFPEHDTITRKLDEGDYNISELEDKIVDITKNVITQLYKTLWTKRGFWRNDLKNKSS
jgi:hypothetical protein